VKQPAAHGGTACPVLTQTAPCNTQECQKQKCTTAYHQFGQHGQANSCHGACDGAGRWHPDALCEGDPNAAPDKKHLCASTDFLEGKCCNTNSCPLVVHNVKMKVKNWASEISWFITKTGEKTKLCSSQKYTGNIWYTDECPLPAGDYTLTCKDSYGDGWHGGYLNIKKKKYCDFKTGYTKIEKFNLPQSHPGHPPG
jgi:hypothetical protein